MGFRFRKSVKIAPGVKVNFGKKSVGVSVGNRGGGISVNSKTGARARASIPGTGVSYSSKLGGSKKKSGSHSSGTSKPRAATAAPRKPITMRWWYFLIAVFFLIGGIGNLGTDIGTGILGIAVFGVMIFFTFYFRKRSVAKAQNSIVEQQINNCRRIITDSFKILQETSDIETFLSRYNVMLNAVKEAGNVAGMDNPCMGDGVTPQQALETMERDMHQLLNPCIDRYMKKKTLHICELTRGRMTKALAVGTIIDEYQSQMPAESVEYWKEQAQKLVDKIKVLDDAEKKS